MKTVISFSCFLLFFVASISFNHDFLSCFLLFFVAHISFYLKFTRQNAVESYFLWNSGAAISSSS